MNQKISYPVIQIRPTGLVSYTRTEYEFPLTKFDRMRGKSIEQLRQVEENRNKRFYTGQMTAGSQKRLRNAINLLIASAKDKEATHFKTKQKYRFKVNFMTLTLPAKQGFVTDKEIKSKCLDPFLKRMKRKHKLGSYVWRAERQKNGNLHFHLLTDTFIHYAKVTADWNAVLQQFRFIDDFESKHGHRQPPSTEIRSVKKVKNLASYMVKYMSKSSENEDVVLGKIWDCSKNLKTKEKCEFYITEEIEKFWEAVRLHQDSKLIYDPQYSLILATQAVVLQLATGVVLQKWLDYLERIRLAGKKDP